jgi:TPR repeat protein
VSTRVDGGLSDVAAEQGFLQAQFNLGACYDQGEGVKADKKEAVKWFRLAAEQGYANAQFNMGYSYAKGYGLKKDKVEAVKWLRLAAEQGHEDAEEMLVRLDEEDY